MDSPPQSDPGPDDPPATQPPPPDTDTPTDTPTSTPTSTPTPTRTRTRTATATGTSPPPPIEPWERLSTEPGPSLLVTRARFDTLRNPRTGAALKRVVLQVPEWVNVVALTPDERLVLVRQYRFGSETVTLEIPGGVVDPGEAPELAARRELREETGYTAQEWISLGAVLPNPAIHDNHCHHFLALGARLTDETELDEGEDIAVELWEREAVRDAVRSGLVSHSLVVSALSRVLDLRRRDWGGANPYHPGL